MNAVSARTFHPIVLSLIATSTACSGYLTPDEVRQHLESPRGSVAQDTVGRATDDFFGAQYASGAENVASFIKGNESSGDGAAAWAANVIASGDMEKAVSMGAVEDIGDLFCAAGLVASIASFDSCDAGDCEAELVIDSCVLRIGENGDELARGKIKFRVKTREESDLLRSELRIEFEDFESTIDTEDGITQYFAGIIALETTSTSTRDEVIFSCDLNQETRSSDRGLFTDYVISGQRLTVAMRFVAETSETAASGTLEILAFLDDTDDTRDESVVLSLAAESRHIDEDTTLAGATLSVRGSNGAFTCTWNAASETVDEDTRTYQANGVCIDEQTGDEFTWESESTRTGA